MKDPATDAIKCMRMITSIPSTFRVLFMIVTLVASFYILEPFSQNRSPLAPSWADQEDHTSTAILSQTANNDPHQGEPRVRQATMIYEADVNNTVYERSVATHIAHGAQWGNPTHILRREIVEAGFFNKPAFLLGLLIEEMAKPIEKRADWIVWFDADTLVLNPNIPWSLFLPPADFEHTHMLATQDQNGFNAGMFILRVHSWSVTALAEVVALRTLQPSVHLDFYDQSAIKWVIERPGYEEHTVYQPHNWWNAFGLQGKPVPSDRWILHFAGVDCCGQEDSKATVMGRWLDILDEGKGGYVVPIEETTLPQEVEQYWDILRTAMKVLQQADAVKDSSSEVQAARNELRSTILRKADDLKLMEDTLLKMKDTMSKATQTRGN